MMTIPTNMLVTAFEPFGGAETNITQEILGHLRKQIGKTTLEKVVLPVSFQRAPVVLREAILEHQPDFVLMLGQCGEGDKLRLERFAHNLMDSEKGDNDGYCPHDEVIDSNAPLALQTPCDIRAVQDWCKEHGLPTILSSSAGLYVCNRVYWEALAMGQKALFVHVPKNSDIFDRM